MIFKKRKGYLPLNSIGEPDEKSDLELSHLSSSATRLKEAERQPWRLLFFATLVLLANYVLKITFSVSPPTPILNVQALLNVSQTGLHRPTLYPGLNEIDRAKFQTRNTSIVNQPVSIMQVSLKEQGSPITKANVRWRWGLRVRRVQVGESTGTIFQFRAIDWGMENCTLHVSVPPSDGGYATRLTPYVLSVDIHSISIPHPINPNAFAFDSVPPPTRLASFSIRHDARWDWQFHCPEDGIFTFLLVSNSDIGSITWWQDGQDAEYGVFITQTTSN